MRTIKGAWSEILGQRLGVRDHFFEVGGDSLAAVRAAAALSSVLGYEVPVKFVFEHPTIAAVLSAIARDDVPGDGKGSGSERASVAPAPSVPLVASPFIDLERRPLPGLFLAGHVPPVEAAAVSYLPTELLGLTGLTRERIVDDWCDGLPVFAGVYDTAIGQIAEIVLPRFASELYGDRDSLLGDIADACTLARHLGARCVSLTGLLPSATDYGRAVVARVKGNADARITTGHATTAGAIVLNVMEILLRTGRRLGNERLGVLGLGSIGRTALRLLLRHGPPPQRILLCDLPTKRDALLELAGLLREQLGYPGAVTVLTSPTVPPDAFYDSSLIIGATNVPSVLDVSRLAAGTLIVDDSAPHCFEVAAAAARLSESCDILFTEGGLVRQRAPIRRLRYLPRDIERLLDPAAAGLLGPIDPHEITGCVLSSGLSTPSNGLPATMGPVDDSEAERHLDALATSGFQGAHLHCGRLVVSDEALARFRDRFGGS